MKPRGFIPIIILVALVVFFFSPFLAQGKLPIPSDTIVGLYHPYRDFYAKDYPRGIPFKNSLITDPVRQQYPWKSLAIQSLKNGQLPLWNPYNFSASPLLGNFQAGTFYPLNIIFFILPFERAWGVFILLQQLLAGIFMYMYLKHLKLGEFASLFGSFVWMFCGFFIAWLEWGTIIHTTLWLPLILLSLDKIFSHLNQEKVSGIRYQVLGINKRLILWGSLFIFASAASFFAGHLQTFFYVFLVSVAHFIFRWFQNRTNKKILVVYLLLNGLLLILISVQLIPTLQFIAQSARDIDQINNWQKDGWFVPWQHLVQFIAPDFFGNPATGNYWGVWNYGEFIGYVGIIPFLFALYSLFFRREKKTFFFGTLFFLSLIFSLPSFVAKIPFVLKIPFIATSQPTRLLFITDFSLAILAALGIDFANKQKKNIYSVLVIMTVLFALLWGYVVFSLKSPNQTVVQNFLIAKQNMILPSVIFASALFMFLVVSIAQKTEKIKKFFFVLVLLITVFDLMRFANKFIPFTSKEYLYPSTKTIRYLQKNLGNYRYMAIDKEIMAPNFSIMHHLQSIDGYDPLYLLSYGQLIAASERKEPNINPPFGFNRIIQPNNYDSKIIDLLGVKYILSLSDLKSPKLVKVFQEGQTRVYENKKVLPRAFFVENTVITPFFDDRKTIEIMFDKDFNMNETAIYVRRINQDLLQSCYLDYKSSCLYGDQITIGKADITQYSGNNISIHTVSSGDGFLVLTDTYYPTWKAYVDGEEQKIYRTDYNFRGIFVSKGNHEIVFHNDLF